MLRNPRMVRLSAVILGIAACVVAVGAEPIKLAGTARFDLSADGPVGAIEEGRFLEGDGSVSRMNWLAAAEQLRGYTSSFPVTYRGWRKAAVQFTPAHAGTVRLTLMGPWEEASRGVLYRQEVLWDDIRVEGATLRDGGFETVRGATAPAWQSGGGTILAQTKGVPAVEGTHYARTWHNQTLSTTIRVTGGRPVTIRIRAAPSVRTTSRR